MASASSRHKSSSSSSRRSQAGGWSEWSLHPSDVHLRYRARINANGEWDYDYERVQAEEEEQDNYSYTAPTSQTHGSSKYRKHDPVVEEHTIIEGTPISNDHVAPDDPDYLSRQKGTASTTTYQNSGTYAARGPMIEDITHGLSRMATTDDLEYDLRSETSVNRKNDGHYDYDSRTSQPLNESSRPQSPRNIVSHNPHTREESFDPNYKVHPVHEFKFGKVFKVLWSEPRGESDASDYDASSVEVRNSRFGEEVYSKVRRFVVIRELPGHCIALPIVSYKPIPKKKDNPLTQAIIYTSHKPEGDKNLLPSIHMVPVNARHKLDSKSRILYSKLYTVEYNVKVWFIGKIDKKSEMQLVSDYNKIHPPLGDRRSVGHVFGFNTTPTSNSSVHDSYTSPNYNSGSYATPGDIDARQPSQPSNDPYHVSNRTPHAYDREPTSTSQYRSESRYPPSSTSNRQSDTQYPTNIYTHGETTYNQRESRDEDVEEDQEYLYSAN